MKTRGEVYKRGDGKYRIRIWDASGVQQTTMVDIVVDECYIEKERVSIQGAGAFIKPTHEGNNVK